MNKIKHALLTALLVSGFIGTTQMNAQTNPCGWTLLNQVKHSYCHGTCEGSILVTPDINLPDVTYLWNTGSTSGYISGLCAGSYTVTVTDPEGCSQEFSYNVQDPLPLAVTCTTTANESAPGAADGIIEANASGGWGQYEYVWLTNPVQYGQVLSGLTAGSYTVRVTDNKKCVAETTCEIITEKKEECDGFKTQTQGGWGQCHQNGNNPGTYLFANFDNAFPNDLIIGCGTKKLKLTTAQAVCDFLSSGSQPRAFTHSGTMVNPGQSYSNVFAGQLVAATINVVFDLYDANFGSSDVNLGDLIIASGPLAGFTVNQLLIEANKKIGGCASPYSASTLSNALDAVNNNYIDGAMDNGYLVCDDQKEEGRFQQQMTELVQVNIHPNPVNGEAGITVQTANNESLQVDLYNVTGQKVNSLFKGEVKSMESINLSIDAVYMDSGIYFVKVITAEKVYTQKFIVKK